jgi:uncharacterized protein YjbI with pentapeptide repeats
VVLHKDSLGRIKRADAVWLDKYQDQIMVLMRWVRQHKTSIVISLGIIIALIVGGIWFWGVLVEYIDPKSGPKGVTDRKDVVQAFALIAAGVVGFIGGLVGIANWDTSRRNLQQQRHLEEQRAQEDALQAYFEQMGALLTEQNLINTDRPDVRQLAQAQSHTVLARLDGPRKGALLRFLHVAGLIRTNDPRQAIWPDARRSSMSKPIVGLSGADLSGAVLREAKLYWADLSNANLSSAKLSSAKLNQAALVSADLSSADLSGAVLGRAVLVWADLTGANLTGAVFNRADLSWVKGITNEEIHKQAKSLKNATMPNGQKYEDWFKSMGKGEK